MITHVAEAGEDRGRVVLHLDAAASAIDPAAFAAVQIAEAYRSEIECLFVEDRRLIDLTTYDFATEIAQNGDIAKPLAIAGVEGDYRLLYQHVHDRIIEAANAANIATHTTLARDEPLRALAERCASIGPWNVVVLAEPLRGHFGPLLDAIFSSVPDMTGVVAVSTRKAPSKGPVTAVVEDINRLPAMLSAAERLASVRRDPVSVLLIGDDPEYVGWMEDQARLAIAEYSQAVEIENGARTFGETDCIAERLRAMKASFIIAQFAGRTVPANDLSAMAATLSCPLFLVR